MAHHNTEHTNPAVTELAAQIDTEHLQDRLTGRSGGLRKSKPRTDQDTGLTQYVWRRAAFHAGQNTQMPVMANSWLQSYLDEQDIDARVIGVLDENGKAVTSYLADLITEILEEMGYDPNRAAKEYKKAGAF